VSKEATPAEALYPASNCFKGQVTGRAPGSGAPFIKETAIAQRHHFRRIYAQLLSDGIYPVAGAFQFRKQPNRCLIHHAMAGIVSEFCPPFFIHEGWFVTEFAEDNGHGLAILDLGFSLDAMFVAGAGIVVTRQAFMGDDPASSILADAQDGLLSAQRTVRRVEENVLLEGARRDTAKSERKQLSFECFAVGNAELDLNFDSAHRLQGTAGEDAEYSHLCLPALTLYAKDVRTLHLKINPAELESKAARSVIKEAAAILRSGGTVAFPTETVYGLGANALKPDAVARIFAAKQRPSWDPLIVHVSDARMLAQVAKVLSPAARKLSEKFWPGPLTLLVEKSGDVPDAVTAGRPKVGVRMPQHPVALALVSAAGIPVAAPSANRFGRTSPTCAEHVAEDLNGRIDAILDAGETWHGLESTVIDTCETPCVVYRPGVVSLGDIRAAGVDAVAYHEPEKLHETPPASLPSPGVGLRHYAPRARLILVDGEGDLQFTALRQKLEQAVKDGVRAGVMLPATSGAPVPVNGAIVFDWGRWDDEEELAHRLFAGLRFLDHAGAAVIFCPLPKPEGLGIAMRDRLRKAAFSE